MEDQDEKRALMTEIALLSRLLAKKPKRSPLKLNQQYRAPAYPDPRAAYHNKYTSRPVILTPQQIRNQRSQYTYRANPASVRPNLGTVSSIQTKAKSELIQPPKISLPKPKVQAPTQTRNQNAQKGFVLASSLLPFNYKVSNWSTSKTAAVTSNCSTSKTGAVTSNGSTTKTTAVISNGITMTTVARNDTALRSKEGQNQKSPSTKSRYRIDRRLKQKPKPNRNSREGLGGRLVRRSSVTGSGRRYIITKYSIRKVLSPHGKRKVVVSRSPAPAKGVAGRCSVIEIQGTKYVSKNCGKTLRRIPTSSLTLSQSQTPRTPAHRIANRVLQKSINTLRKRNEACAFFTRFGKCKRFEASSCPFVHDPNARKLLSKTQPCRFFRRGSCSRENCPYPHVMGLNSSKKRGSLTLCSPGILSKLKKRRNLVFVKKAVKKGKEEKGTRYYTAAAEPNPISAIVKRRRRPSVVSTVVSEEPDSSDHSVSDSGDSDGDADTESNSQSQSQGKTNAEDESKSPESDCVSSTSTTSSRSGHGSEEEDADLSRPETVSSAPAPAPSTLDLRRIRLMSKVASLKQRLEGGPPMPDFLSFN